MPGWVGQNWSLQAGGVITRTIKTGADELHTPDYGLSNEGYGYFYPQCHLLNTGQWDSESYMQYLWSERLTINASDGIAKEFEPDIFTFNFMGHTGKFFMGEDGQWKVSSPSNLKVIIEESDLEYPFGEDIIPFNNDFPDVAGNYSTTKMIYRIRIIDDLGNEYVFGNTASSVEYSVPFFRQSPYNNQYPGMWMANSWYLTQVNDRFGNEVYAFEYERGDYIASFYKYYESYVFNADFDENFLGFDADCTMSGSNGQFIYNGALISPVYLKRINTLKGDIDFNRTLSFGKSYFDDPAIGSYIGMPQFMSYTNQYFYYYLLPYGDPSDIIDKLKWQKLTSISGLSKDVELTFNDLAPDPITGEENDNERLNLLSVNIDDKEYSFEYDSVDQLPSYLSTKMDHWGYFDGSDWVVNPFAGHYASRQVHAQNVKKGMLTKLTYPTKGWTEFTWEANSYSGYVSDDKSQVISTSNTLAGGVRIQQIRNNDGKGNEVVKDYKYVKGFETNPLSTTSSGILESNPKYVWEDFSIISYNYPEQYILYEDLYSTNPILPLSNYLGSHIGYSEVVELLSDGSYTLYEFTSNSQSDYRDYFNYYSLNPSLSPYTNYSDRSLLRGKTKEIRLFDSNNTLKKRVTNSYSYNDAKYARGVYVLGEACNSTGYGFLKASRYRIYYFDNNLVEQQVVNYENGQQLTENTQYGWEYYPDATTTFGDQFPTFKRTQGYGNEGDADEEFYKETYDYTFDHTGSPFDELVGQRYLQPLGTTVFRNTEQISSKKLEYGYFGSEILPERTLLAKGMNPFEETQAIDSYTSGQRVAKYHKKEGSYTYYTYKKVYDSDCYCYRETGLPLFKVEGAELASDLFLSTKTDELNTTSGLGLEDRVALQQEVRDHYPDNMVTSYTYILNVGVNSITDRRGETEYYIYDANDRLIRIEDNDGRTLKQFIYNYKTE